MFLFLRYLCIYLRILIRIVFICVWLLCITIFLIILRPFNFSIYANIPRFFHIGFLKIFNIKVNLVGKIHKERPGLLISNHASWLDIPILSSLTNISFIAKSEISKWPLFGFLAKLQDTVFVERRSIKAVKQKNEINNILIRILKYMHKYCKNRNIFTISLYPFYLIHSATYSGALPVLF